MTDTLTRPAPPPATAAPACPAPPRLVLAVAAVVLLAGVVMVLVGSWRIGISWDESYHIERLRNFLAHGWYLLDGDLAPTATGATPGSWGDQRYVYGPVGALVLHAWSVLCGVESWGTVSPSADAYAVRHLGVALISLVGVAATAGITRLLLRRWSWGLVAAAAMVAIPTWTGHAMFNVKDIPVATGYTLVTLGACLMVRTPTRWWPALMMLLGAVLSVGTRPGIWPGVGLAFFLCAVHGLLARDRRRIWWLVGAGLLGLLALWLASPEQFADPLTALWDSVMESKSFDDKVVGSWYLPVYLLVELPEPLLAAGAIGTLLALHRLRRADGAERTIVLLVLAQTYVLAVLAVAARSNIYTGIRQFLFASPGLAILVTLTLVWLVGRAPAWRRWVAAGVLVWPVAAMAPLFPFAYVHHSVIATALEPIVVERMNHPQLEVQTDYWRTSVRELAAHIPTGGIVICSPGLNVLDPDAPFRRSSRGGDCGEQLISPLAAYDDARTGTWEPTPTQFLAVRTGNDSIGSNCTELAAVTRWLYWSKIVLGTVSRCETVPDAYPPAGIRFDGAGAGSNFEHGGWSLHHTEPGAVVRSGETGELAMTMPRAGDITLTGNATGLAGATLEANGTEVPITVDGDRFSMSVPAGVAAAYGQNRLFLDFTAGPEDIHLLTLGATIS